VGCAVVEPSLRVELSRVRTPDTGSDLELLDGDVNDLSFADPDREDRLAISVLDGLCERDDVVFLRFTYLQGVSGGIMSASNEGETRCRSQ
jgi:hypothetical protein